MLATEIQKAIEVAKQNVQAQDFDEKKYSLDEVVKSLREATLPSEFTASIILELATVLRKLGKGLNDNYKDGNLVFKQTQEVLNKGLAMYPDDIELVNEQRKLYYDAAQYDTALASWRSVIDNDPPPTAAEMVVALENAGACLRELRKFSEADDMFNRADAISGRPSIRLLIERGWLRFYQEQYDLAFKDFADAESQAGPDATRENKHDAMVGQIASRQAEDALNPDGDQDRARQLVEGWKAGPFKEELASILFASDSIHTNLNLYRAAFLNYDLLLEAAPDNPNAWCKKIGGLNWLRRFKEAEELYRTAHEKFPDDIELWKQMGDVHYQQKRFRESYSYYSGKALEELAKNDSKAQALIDNLKKDDEAAEWTIVTLRKLHDLRGARKKVDEALATRGNKINFLSERAVIDFAERKYDSAIKFFNRALEIDEHNDFALQWRAASYRKTPKMVKPTPESEETPDFTEAREKLEEALEILPAAAGLWEERAWLAFDQGDLKSAGEYFDESIRLDPYMIQRQFSRIEVFARLNLSEEALSVFRKLEDQFPDDAEVAEQLSWFYLRLGRLEQAKENFESIEAHHPGHVLGINAKGGYELERRNYLVAEECFRRAIDKVDYEPQYYLNLAWALLGQLKEPGELRSSEISNRDNLLDKATESCRTALELDPYNAKAYGCLGVIAYKRNAFRDAEAYFRKSIEVSPQEGSYVELATLYCEMGRYDDATKTLAEADKLNKPDARVHIEWGNLYVLQENNKEAIRSCRAAVSAEPNNADAHRALAIALMRSEQYDEAEASIRKALRMVAPNRQWRLHLLLSQVLVRLGDIANKDRKKKDPELYDEALKYVNAAKGCTSLPNADIFFHAGIVQYKLEDYRSSQRNFADCLNANRDRFEAERYGSMVQALIDQEKRLFRVSKRYGYVLSGICILMLLGLWISYYRGSTRTILVAPPAAANGGLEATRKREPQDEFTVDKNLLTVLTPILLGLLVVAALLPNLSKLKLPGVEAETNEPKPEESNISRGPQGEIGFGSSLPVISPEPR
ncbi:MAG: hypothetical protein QOH41_804 [Blastocatellia bacterium]|jgi:tetratricopeptide (TPR) repeat protein|nr:hypothetical protein [Blastocatellia bacterium]